MLGSDAVAYLRAADIGTRVVVRHHFGEGATDALGLLVSRDADTCVIDTKRGQETVAFAAVIAAKSVPPPPAPRPRRRPTA